MIPKIHSRRCPECGLGGQDPRWWRDYVSKYNCGVCGWTGTIDEMAIREDTLTLYRMQKLAHQNAKEKGFHDPTPEFGTLLALMHSELSEALEAHREGERFKLNLKPDQWAQIMSIDDLDKLKVELGKLVKYQPRDHYTEELADVMIRVADMAGAMGIDLEAAVVRKMEKNADRPHRHGKRY